MLFSLTVQVCENLARHGWHKVWLEDQKSPYAYGGDQWVGYDDARSLRIKVNSCYARLACLPAD